MHANLRGEGSPLGNSYMRHTYVSHQPLADLLCSIWKKVESNLSRWLSKALNKDSDLGIFGGQMQPVQSVTL